MALDYRAAAPDMTQANMLRAQDEQRQLALMGKLGGSVGSAVGQGLQAHQSRQNLNELLTIANQTNAGQFDSTMAVAKDKALSGVQGTDSMGPIAPDDRQMLADAGFDTEDKMAEFMDTVSPLVNLPPEQAAQALLERADTIAARGGNPEDSLALAQNFMVQPEQAVRQINTITELMQNERARELIARDPSMLKVLEETGLQGLGGASALGTEAKFFKSLTKDLTDEEKDIARRVELGLAPRAGTITGTERIVEDPDLADKVITFEADKAGSKEKSKLKQQLEIGPMIARANAQAAVEGKDRGDDIVRLNFLDSNAPNIEATVNKLNELNKIATYTTGGLIADGVFRQMGWTVPKGATARAQAQSLIATTILPLLKPTFGAAFTEQEGDKLLATWGDPDASPEEKEMALQGMMYSVKLQGETLRRKLGKKLKKASKPTSKKPTSTAKSNRVKFDAEGNIIQ